MNVDNNVLTYAERIGFALRGLYSAYGYAQYKMSKFEEYDLYARNKEFLVSDSVITFTDLSGRLMALKPDVTLSIVRSGRDTPGAVQKVYYAENVYRVTGAARSFREIMQTGLECIGEIDGYCLAEVLTLAAKSLHQISENWVLYVSHLDIVSELIGRLGVSPQVQEQLLGCISGKNLHELSRLCAKSGAEPGAAAALRELLRTNGSPAVVLPRLRELGCAPQASAQLETLCADLAAVGLDERLCIDFSLISDMNYYNGIVFRGFVDGVPDGVLSGGQYDRLMAKMGRRASAVGFAVYLDALERMDEALPRFDADMLLLYDASSSSAQLCHAVEALTAQGLSVRTQRSIPEKLQYRQLARLNGSEVEILETHA